MDRGTRPGSPAAARQSAVSARGWPFTAKWHPLSVNKCFDDPAQCKLFRQELADLQKVLRLYSAALAQIAGVEDLTALEA